MCPFTPPTHSTSSTSSNCKSFPRPFSVYPLLQQNRLSSVARPRLPSPLPRPLRAFHFKITVWLLLPPRPPQRTISASPSRLTCMSLLFSSFRVSISSLPGRRSKSLSSILPSKIPSFLPCSPTTPFLQPRLLPLRPSLLPLRTPSPRHRFPPHRFIRHLVRC